MSRVDRLKNENRPRPLSLSMGEGVNKLAEMVNSFLPGTENASAPLKSPPHIQKPKKASLPVGVELGPGAIQPKDFAAQQKGATRDKTEIFCQVLRPQYRQAGEKRLELLLTKKAKLSYDLQADSKGNKKPWIADPKDEDYKICKSCRLCGAAFSLFRKKYRCPLCENYICGACCSFPLQLDPVFLNDKPVDIIVCKGCGPVVKKGEALLEFQEEKEKATKHSILYYHGIMQEIIASINTLLPRYISIMTAPSPTVKSLKPAEEIELKLVELFRNFDIGMKKIESLKFEKATDIKIQQNVKYGLVLYLQDNVMQFRSLQSQRKEIEAKAVDDEKHKAKQSMKNNKDLSGSGPYIVSVEPAMSPRKGTRIVITGENFVPETQVFIENIRCKKRFVNKEKILIKSPSFEEEGLKDISVKNPDKKSHLLPKIILYSDEYFKLATPPAQRLDDPDPDVVAVNGVTELKAAQRKECPNGMECTSQDPQHYMEFQHTKKRPATAQGDSEKGEKENTASDTSDVDKKIDDSIRELLGSDADEDEEDYSIRIGPDKIDLLVERALQNREKSKKQQEEELERQERERKLQEERERQRQKLLEEEKARQLELKKKRDEEAKAKREKEIVASFTPQPRVYNPPPPMMRSNSMSIEDMVASSSSPVGPPSIATVHPAICGVNGARMRLTGKNFCTDTTIYVGGVKINKMEFRKGSGGESDTLEFVSPKLKAGIHPVSVVNPGGAKDSLDGILLYTDDASLLGGGEQRNSGNNRTRTTVTRAATTNSISRQRSTTTDKPSVKKVEKIIWG